jgi:hypothetical protein
MKINDLYIGDSVKAKLYDENNILAGEFFGEISDLLKSDEVVVVDSDGMTVTVDASQIELID